MRAEDRAAREVERLKQLGLRAPDVHPRDEYLAPRDEALLHRILREDTRGDAVRAPSAVVRVHRRWAFRAAAVVGCLAALGAAAVRWQTPQQPAAAGAPAMLAYSEGTPEELAAGELPSAFSDLRELAEVADAAPRVDAGVVQYVESYSWFTVEDASSPATSTALVPTWERSWLGADGAVMTEQLQAAPFDAKGRLTDVDAEPTVVAGDRLPSGTLDAREVDVLPTEPDQLRDALLRAVPLMDCAGETEEAACLVAAMSSLTSSYVVPPTTQAAFWRVLADEPAIRSLGAVTDRAGRLGRAFGFAQDAGGGVTWIHVLVVDERTGQLCAEEEARVTDGAAVVTSLSVLTRTAWVSTLGELPAR